MRGTCDICQCESEELSRVYVSNIETFVCDECQEGKTERANRRYQQSRHEPPDYEHEDKLNRED